jgi:flagellar motor switch/type III secretory pathway protein FliN
VWTPRPVGRDEARIGTAVARWLGPRAGSLAAVAPVLADGAAQERGPAGHWYGGSGFTVAGAPARARLVRTSAAASIDPDGAVAVVRGGPEPVLVVGGGGLVRGLAQVILGGPAELAAARAPTVAEQAVWALAVAAGLDAAGAAAGIAVEPSTIAPAMAVRGSAAVVELAVEGGRGVRGAAWIALPASVLERAPAAVALAELGGAWLDGVEVSARVVVAHAAHGDGEVAAHPLPDVIVVGAIAHGHGHGVLRVARGELPVTVDGDRVTVRGPYQRGRMDETLGEDLTVELAVSAGAVTLSARKLLELAPGEVLALGRPAAGQVELVVGRRVIGTGELIDVDGELAVRVLTTAPR